MLDLLGLGVSARFLFQLLLGISFFIGIMLIVSGEAYGILHKELQKEYGIKKRLAPKIENTEIDLIDRILIKYRFKAGLFIAITSFFLLLIYK
jgi:hypothetical protein